jgi:2-oxoglutarate dehydrogenase E1 component
MAKEDIANCFRRWGYLQADVDPLGTIPKIAHRDIDQASGAEAEKWRNIYCSKVGVEFMHMPYPERCDWIADRFENFKTPIDQKQLLHRLMTAERLETFIHGKYIGSKWFSLEGLTAMIPVLDTIFAQAAERGIEVAIIGMAHRGRINVLYHSAGQPASSIFACFEDVDPRSVLGSGDTKYHKGATGVFSTPGGKEIRVHLGSNPSHLEAVNPVIMGRVRARQMRLGDQGKGEKVMAILIHGDAAFAGQGVAAESLNFAGLRGFSIGGTMHIIANNLIGFTARPSACFSGHFSSDIAKRLAMPIFHVNGDSPEDAVRIAQIATDYRCDFGSDVLIDLIGYRRFGHNEMDDPTTTAPRLYEKIKSHPLLHQMYAKQIGVADKELAAMEETFISQLKEEHEKAQSITKQPKLAKMPDYWDKYTGGFYDPSLEVETSVPEERLREITEKLTALPQEFNVHAKIRKGYEQRLEMGTGKRPIDWGMAEALAFGSLLWDGVPVRITGQDSRRATFNQRQAVLYDLKSEEEYIPLNHLHPKQGWFEVYDSMLSEAAAVGFEYGFARDFPEALVCWEAQFGDFVNGAQIIIDQFITAGEDKWSLLSGVVLLLPHAYEGMGPEHSSARIERFLQLGGEDNIQVAYPSTAAQYFHLLRRQVLQRWRKPLVVFTPKSLLRAPAAAAQLADLAQGSFQKVIDDADTHADAERILLCSGKIVHELRAERKKGGHDDTAIVALEQLYPFPEEELLSVLNKYPAARGLVWVQEEPANMGPLSYVKPLLERLAGERSVTTVKRSASASPATGSPKAHAMEQEAIIKFAFAKYH